MSDSPRLAEASPRLDPPLAAEATLIGSLLLGHTRLDEVAALRPEHFTERISAELFVAIRERLSALPDEELNSRFQAIIKAVPAAPRSYTAWAMDIGRFAGIGPTVVARILDTWLRRRLKDVAKTIKRELRAPRLTADEVLNLAERRLADLRAALP
jgi:hypothetical protein